MKYISCQSCGLVIDSDVATVRRQEVLNHDQDMKCIEVKCPLCKSWTPNEEWEEIEEDIDKRKHHPGDFDDHPSNEQMEYFKRGGR